MQEVAAVRGAARDALDDVVPETLRDHLVDRLEDGSMAPGVLTVLSARAAGGSGVPELERSASDGDVVGTGESALPLEAVAERGAGVQLIYEGLRLTRTLAREEPWTADGEPVAPDGRVATNGRGERARDDADMAILVADILVARGFYLLARTDAAEAAVGVVQSFGRDQTVRRTTGDADLDRNLEADVFELAAVAGTTAVGASPTAKLRSHVIDLARTDGRLPLADGLFSESTVETLAGLVPDERAGGSGVATSADH